MKTFVLRTAMVLACCFAAAHAGAQGTAFTYQGTLNNGGAPANGLYDFQFRVATSASGGTYVGKPFPTNAVSVQNGYFTVVMDFGTGVFTGQSLWLQVEV